MKKTFGIIALLYLVTSIYILTSSINTCNPDSWVYGLCLLNVSIVTIWGDYFMSSIGGEAFLVSLSPWLYLIPIVINSLLIFSIGILIKNTWKRFRAIPNSSSNIIH